MSDCIVIGGGVIGLSIANELAGQGVSVTVLEAGQFGKEASWAGAGILPPGNPRFANSPEARLRAFSHVLWPRLTAQLLEETGIDNGYFNCGGIEVCIGDRPDELTHTIERWRADGVEVEELNCDSITEIEPNLSPGITAAICIPEKCQVRNPRHLKALYAAAAQRGVQLIVGCPVSSFDCDEQRAMRVKTPQGDFAAGQFVVASGAWSQRILADVGCEVDIEPVRGQMVQLSLQPLPFRHVIGSASRYLVPRPDGRILIGSTEEWVGFDKQNTAGAVAELIRFGSDLVPQLATARFERSWAGLRPGTSDRLPFIGQVPGMQNVYVAAGHFRSGLQMSPATALVMRQLLLGQELEFPLDGLGCDRFNVVTARS